MPRGQIAAATAVQRFIARLPVIGHASVDLPTRTSRARRTFAIAIVALWEHLFAEHACAHVRTGLSLSSVSTHSNMISIAAARS
jgi:hypothetical protein